MAGAKINTKSKGRDDKSKGNKNINSTNEESEDHDFSLLRKPVPTSITGFAQARKIFDFATEELKSLLSNECDLLYECKVCRNIFRSLANFISHKRVYCKEKFNSSMHSHFVNKNSAANEILKIKQMEEAYQESLKVTELEPNDIEDRIPLTKDLTGIMEKLTKIKGRYNFDEQQVTLQKIPSSSVAVFQSHCEENKFDNMLAQVHELDNMISQDNAVLQRDGSFNIQSSLNADGREQSDNVIQISDDEDSDESIPKCKICDMQFSTQKTLKFHMKYKHLESRLVYPCPDCFEIFSTSWSVYRHLFKVHRKSATQIRRLRESIQAKAFRMNNPPAFYEKKKNSKPVTPQKISEEERLDQENQAWMDNMEGDGELPRCGGCGRTFERRAALAAHTHTCQPRCRALSRRPDVNTNNNTSTNTRRIEIQIRKDYHKGPAPSPAPAPAPDPTLKDENKQVNEESQDVAKPRPETNEPELIEKSNLVMNNKNQPEEKVSEPIPTQTPNNNDPTERKPIQKMTEPSNNTLEEATMDIIDEKSSDSVDSPEKATAKTHAEKKPKLRLPFAHQAEKSNLAAFRHRMRGDIDLEKLICKKCDMKHDKLLDLHDHMAAHYKWMRYACKLCNFKNYEFEKLPEHVKVVHKLKGDSDFYFSTVKAVDGVEALALAEPPEESEATEESPESRRPSRCSSDSSRLSDDSSSSSTRVETGSRKRKMYQNRSAAKRKKDSNVNDETGDTKESEASTDKPANNIGGSESPSNVKAFEENSSDMDDVEDKIAKRNNTDETSSVASRRPVRKKTKPKNEDFEYDLSNLLKMEAQGYRDSQVVTTTKTTQTKKKLLQELLSNYDNINKEHIGALALLSKKAVDVAAAELRTNNFSAPIFNVQNEQRIANIFARPMVPKVSRGDKMSPRKDPTEEVAKEGPSSNKVPKIQDTDPIKETKTGKTSAKENMSNPSKEDVTPAVNNHGSKENAENTESNESVKSKLKIPAVMPLKFRSQSLELMKNPIINKNISDFSKAGMKTKILLIKPINRNKDGVSLNTPLKFQTIKLKDPNKGTSSNDEKSNDQIVVVKVPKVERTVARNVPDNNSNEQLIPANRPDSNIVNDVEPQLNDNKPKPIQTNKNNNKKSDIIDTDKINTFSSSLDQINANDSGTTESLSSHAEIVEPTNDKDGCGILISSNKSVAMDVDKKLDKSVADPVGVSDSNNELTNSESTCVQDSSMNPKPKSELLGINPEPCTSSNYAINIPGSVNMDSAVFPNGPPT